MISIIIPTYNDQLSIARTITYLKENSYTRLLKEIIIVDAGSTDNTVSEARKAGATVLHSIRRSQAFQLNLGVKYSSGKILYFLRTGCLPSKNFTNEIVRVFQKGISFGFFTPVHTEEHWLVKAHDWLSERNIGFASVETQSMFVTRELFTKAGSFREDHQDLADAEIIERFRRYGKFIVLKEKLLTSAKAPKAKETLRSEIQYFISRFLYKIGWSQQKIQRVCDALWTSNEKLKVSQPNYRPVRADGL
jgi:glycosyltransferase involved in cell wall biosynthesis